MILNLSGIKKIKEFMVEFAQVSIKMTGFLHFNQLQDLRYKLNLVVEQRIQTLKSFTPFVVHKHFWGLITHKELNLKHDKLPWCDKTIVNYSGKLV